MVGAKVLPKGLQSKVAASQSSKGGWIRRNISHWLEGISCAASKHPIHTIVIVAVFASSTYVSLLEGRLFQDSVTINTPSSRTEFESLVAGGKTLWAGDETEWRWQAHDHNSREPDRNLALITLAFPDSLSLGSSQNVASPASIPIPHNSSAIQLSSSSDTKNALSHDSTLAFSLPYDEAAAFLTATQEIPALELKFTYEDELNEDQREELKWVMEATKTSRIRSRSISQWIHESWNTFSDLLKNAESLDIAIMALGYLSMHLTFVALFLSMRRLGSNFWLATSVLLSSVFAFLFGLHVTMRFGVPINMVLLSEGLPFLVVTIGFEKPIILTKSVLSASLDVRKTGASNGEYAPSIIRQAIQMAINEIGASIIRDYCLEILILVAGAASGIQGGLRQFCFLAAWTLFFDCILLFTFYMSILTIKVEINRIKRHVTMRKALIEDGVSRRVAETVASSNEWPSPKDGKAAFSGESAFFGRTIRDSSVPKFKAIMVSGFILINILNLCKLPFSSWSKADKTFSAPSMTPTLPFDPFIIAGNALNEILAEARSSKVDTAVTVLAPIKYELYSLSLGQYLSEDAYKSFLDFDYSDQMLNGVGGKVVEGVLKSFEDPILSKWMIAALALSLVLNGYLFNAARWSIKDPTEHSSVYAAEPFSQANRSLSASESNVIKSEPFLRESDTSKDEEEEDSDDGFLEINPRQAKKNRTLEECEHLLRQKKAHVLQNEELTELSLQGKIPGYALEKSLGDMTRAVRVRRAVVARTPATRSLSMSLESSKLPYKNFDYERVHGACCENVIGYLPLPVGVAGPLMVDGQNYFIPMATTEGVLVASTSRGARAINAGGGAITCLTGDGMTRGPCIAFSTLSRAGAAKLWLDSNEGFQAMKTAFDSTSRFARLKSLKTSIAGTYLYVRFKTTTGDAMGMNMISKGVEHALHVMSNDVGFEDMSIISVSGNFCTDKKPAAVNWIDGRGKSVVAEAIIPEHIIKTVLKSDVNALVELNMSKNLIGSAMAGSVGGFNAHAANIVTAMFLATGQDAAQNVESSNCITVMKNFNGNLQISVSMPSIEVGTIGGGTILEPQAAMLDLLGVRGAHQTNPGDNARRLARLVAATVLAGELSLCSALAAGHLVKAHMQHNRSAAPSRTGTPTPTSTSTSTSATAASATASTMTHGSNKQSTRPAGLNMTSGG